MLNEVDRNIIVACARKYDVSAMHLFGSSVHDPAPAHDMDDLLRDIAAESERVEARLSALEKTWRRRRRTLVELAAIATCLHNS